MRACAEPCCADSPDSPTFAEQCCADSPDSPTFAEPCCVDSPDSPTLAEPCCADSPDSPTRSLASFWEKCDLPWHIRASNAQVSRIWREWPLLSFIAFLITGVLKFCLNGSNIYPPTSPLTPGPVCIYADNWILYWVSSNGLVQGWPMRVPRAILGPPRLFEWTKKKLFKKTALK